MKAISKERMKKMAKLGNFLLKILKHEENVLVLSVHGH